MNSETIRISELKHFEYVQVVCEKFEGFADAFADILKNESDMLSLLKRGFSDEESQPRNIVKPVPSKKQVSEHLRVSTENVIDPMQVLNIVEKIVSLTLPHSTPSTTSMMSGISDRIGGCRPSPLTAPSGACRAWVPTVPSSPYTKCGMPSVGSNRSEQCPPSIISDHSEHRIFDGMAKLQGHVSSDMKCLSEFRHDELIMFKLSDISEKVSSELRHDEIKDMMSRLSDIIEKVSEYRISEHSSISERTSEHCMSKECCTNGSDHSISDQLVSETCQSDVAGHVISESCAADGSKQPDSSEGLISGVRLPVMEIDEAGGDLRAGPVSSLGFVPTG